MLVLAASIPAAFAQQPDPQLSAYIDAIRVVDNHAHVVAPDPEHDRGFDALRCDELPPGVSAPPANLRFGSDIQSAWKALYGFAPASEKEAESKLASTQAPIRQQQGENYFDWVLGKAGVDTVLANRVFMAPQLKSPHFRWVPYDDALLFPLDNSGLKAANPDRRVLFTMNELLRKRYLDDAKLTGIPATLEEYLDKMVRPTLQRQKEAGAVAIKFEVAYLRSLDFEPASDDAAAAVYQKYATSGTPGAADYKILQDFLFHFVTLEAGRLGMAVHIHTGFGCGEFFDDRGADPMLLESVFNDESLRKTNFVLLHGGTPFNRHVATTILKPNVYGDTSLMEFLFSAQEMANILRPWLELMPERVIFGSDAGPMGPGYGWEESSWVGTHRAKQALAIVLSQMIRDGVITDARARDIAEMVLRGNAVKLYRLQ